MRKKIHAQSGGRLTELAIVLVFFVIISVFLLKIFAKTEQIRSQASAISHAVSTGQSEMELLLSKSAVDWTSLGYHSIGAEGNLIHVKYYDKNWNEADTPSRYALTVSEKKTTTAYGILIDYYLTINEVETNSKGQNLLTLNSACFGKEEGK